MRRLGLVAALAVAGCAASEPGAGTAANAASPHAPKASVKGWATATGAKIEKFDRTVADMKRSIRQCYVDGGPSSAGSLDIRWTVATDGSVQNIELRPNAIGDAVARCVAKIVVSATFEPPQGGPGPALAHFDFAWTQ